MAGTAEIDVRNAGGSISFHMAVAERAVQFGRLSVTEVIKHHGLIHRGPGKYWENTVKEAFRLDLKSVVGNDGNHKDANNDCETHELSSHSISLLVQTEI